jgi:hypothetical protein
VHQVTNLRPPRLLVAAYKEEDYSPTFDFAGITERAHFDFPIRFSQSVNTKLDKLLDDQGFS